MTIPDIFIVTLDAWDVVEEEVVTFRYAQRLGYTTTPSDTPANTVFDAVVKEPCDLRRWMFDVKKTSGRSAVGFGQIVLLNGDGALDDLANPAVYSIDGRPITVERGPASGGAYPGDFDVVFSGSMQYAQATPDEIRIDVRDNQSHLVGPLQSEKYAGDNVLPDGLEGTADDLRGKPKPVLLGTVQNIRPPCVNISKLIYQVSDDAANSIDMVYDRGIRLSVGLAWTLQTSGFGASEIAGVAFGNGIWVAVGTGGVITYSTDSGLTWNTAGTPSFGGTDIFNVAFGNGVFVACGASGKIATSTDGDVWTQRTSGFGASGVRGVRYGDDGYWVIVGGNNLLSTATDPTSTWTLHADPSFGADAINCVAYRTGQWVIGGITGKLATASDPTSTWTQQTTGLANALRDAVFARGTWVLVASAGEIATSPDGVTWTERENASTSVYSVTDANGLFIGVGLVGIMVTSPDGINWTTQTTAFGTTRIRWIAFDGDGLLVAVGESAKLATTTPYGETYADATDLEDDTLAPAPGTYKVFLNSGGSYFRLGSEPAGEITCDATSGASAANRYAGKVFTFVLTRAGFSAGEWNTSDITTLDAAADYVIGYWTDEETTFADVLDKIAGSVGAGWFVDQAGVYRIKQLLLATGTPAMDFVAADLKKPLRLVRPSESGGGVPTYQRKVRYAKNYTVQTSDVAAGVTADRRAFLADEWREAVETDATIQTANLLAKSQSEDSLLAAEADADDEATRRQVISGTQRRWFELDVALDDETFALDLNNVVSLTHARYGLSGGQSFRILGIGTRGAKGELTLTVWG